VITEIETGTLSALTLEKMIEKCKAVNY
jgi:hypothetical protein